MKCTRNLPDSKNVREKSDHGRTWAELGQNLVRTWYICDPCLKLSKMDMFYPKIWEQFFKISLKKSIFYYLINIKIYIFIK